jgi:hypothetical protein
MSKEPPPFRLLSNEEFERMNSPEKMEYIRQASAYLSSLIRGREGGNGAGRYAGPERRQNRPGFEYQGIERRRA